MRLAPLALLALAACAPTLPAVLPGTPDAEKAREACEAEHARCAPLGCINPLVGICDEQFRDCIKRIPGAKVKPGY